MCDLNITGLVDIIADTINTDTLILNNTNLKELIEKIDEYTILKIIPKYDSNNTLLPVGQQINEIRFYKYDKDYDVAISNTGLMVKMIIPILGVDTIVWYNVNEKIAEFDGKFINIETDLGTIHGQLDTQGSAIAALEEQILESLALTGFASLSALLTGINSAIATKANKFVSVHPLFLEEIQDADNNLKLLYNTSHFTSNLSNELEINDLYLNTKFDKYSVERQYPPNVFDSKIAETTISFLGFQSVFYQEIYLTNINNSYGNGTYKLYSSSRFPYTEKSVLFDFILGPTARGEWANNQYSNGVYVANPPYYIVNDYQGDFLVVEFPFLINLTKFSFRQYNTYELANSPALWRFYGSTDGINWVVIPEASNDVNELTDLDYTGTYPTYTHTLQNMASPYKYLGFTINKLLYSAISSTSLILNEVIFYGKEYISLPYEIIDRSELISSNFTTINEVISDLNNKDLFFNANKIGIGIQNPSTSLDVVGSISTDTKILFHQSVSLPQSGINGSVGDRLILYQGGPGIYPYSIGVNTNDLWFSIPDNSTYSYYINGDKKLLINTNGNIGIGTNDTQTYKLYVNGDTYTNNITANNITANSLIGAFTKYSSIREYPPKIYDSFTAETTTSFLNQNVYYQTFTLSGASYGNGVYEIYSSTTNTTNTKEQFFDKNLTTTSTFSINQYTNGLYSGTNSIIQGDTQGDWIILKVPEFSALIGIEFTARPSYIERAPGTWKFYGSINGTNFEEITEASQRTNITTTAYIGTNNVYTKTLNTQSKAYNYFGIVVDKLAGYPSTIYTTLNWNEIKFYCKTLLSQNDDLINTDILRTYDYSTLTETDVINMLGSKNMHFDNNKIGIGVTNPSNTLDVNGIVKSTNLDITGNANILGLTYTGYIGIGTTNSVSKLTINPIVVDRYNFNHSNAVATLTHQTPTSTTTLNDPKPIIHLCRQGTSIQSYGAKATFSLCRYVNEGVASRTRLDLSLAHTYYDDINIISFRSDGRIGIGKTDPNYTLDVVGGINSSSGLLENGTLLTTKYLQIANINNHFNSSNIYSVNGNIGIGIQNPAQKLHILGNEIIQNGYLNVNGGNPYATNNNFMLSGSLCIGDITSNYGGGTTGWNTNTAGLLMECQDNTEIGIHDANNRLVSLMYYKGGSDNYITYGREMYENTRPNYYQFRCNNKFQVYISGATSGWQYFTIEPTSLWGDGCTTASETAGTQFLTMRNMMFQNPHIVSSSVGGTANIRFGRAGGVSTGTYWDTGLKSNGEFLIGKEGGDTGLHIKTDGSLDIQSSGTTIGNFRHINLTQGIGIGYNSISASGTNTDQDITISSKGNGYVNITNRLNVNTGINNVIRKFNFVNHQWTTIANTDYRHDIDITNIGYFTSATGVKHRNIVITAFQNMGYYGGSSYCGYYQLFLNNYDPAAQGGFSSYRTISNDRYGYLEIGSFNMLYFYTNNTENLNVSISIMIEN